MVVHPWKTNIAMENHHFLVGNASSNDWFSIVMLVFRGGIIVQLVGKNTQRPVFAKSFRKDSTAQIK